MTTKVHKIGNSLSVYIPKNVAHKAGVVRGTPVFIKSVGRRIIVEPVERKETLEDLLSSYTKKTRQPFIDFGPDIGREIVD